MGWRGRIASRLEACGIPHLTLILTIGSVVSYITATYCPPVLALLPLVREPVMRGQVWRLITFLVYPLSFTPILALFTYYFFYVMGTTLEAEWGEAKFTAYVLISAVSTGIVIWSGLAPEAMNQYLYGSIFLAFACLYPTRTVYLFLVIPVQMKYLAWLQCAFYALMFVLGSWSTRLALLLVHVNVFVFFGKTIVGNARAGRHRMREAAREVSTSRQSFHTCAVCRVTEKQDPVMEFRVCTLCAGGRDYCREHLAGHEHVKSAP